MKGDVIFCKKHPFIITKDGYIDHYTTGVMDNIFQAPDSELEVLQETVKSQNWKEVEALFAKCFFHQQAITKQETDCTQKSTK